jgi:hypothetical protein
MKTESKEKKEKKTTSANAINDEEDHHSEHGDNDINIDEVKIADIVFAFDNDVMIKDLKQRAIHLMFNRYEKARAIEEKICNYKANETNYEKLIRPVDAFITFEEEDGKIVAESLEAEHDFFGKKKQAEY